MRMREVTLLSAFFSIFIAYLFFINVLTNLFGDFYLVKTYLHGEYKVMRMREVTLLLLPDSAEFTTNSTDVFLNPRNSFAQI